MLIFLQEPLPGCPSYSEFVDIPIEISESCYATCPVYTTVNYLCDELSPSSAGAATCTADYTWHHSPSLENCTPLGKKNLQNYK